MKRIFTSILFVFFHLFGFAQVPPNNDCTNATALTDLNNYCSQQLFGEPTFDITDGPCAPAFNPALNIWYKFTAMGTSVTISASSGSNIFKITLVRFPSGSCGIAEILDCNLSNLNATNLTIGNEYFIIISSGNVTGNFELCINNPIPSPPPNNDPCAAILLENEVSTCGSTVEAMATIPAVGLPCPTISANQIWYTVTVPPNETNLEINLLAGTLTGSAQVIIGQWTNGCTGTFQYEPGHHYCGPASNTFEFSCMNPGTYHLLLSSNNAGAGEFCITYRSFNSPPECALNDNCLNALGFTLFMNSDPICIQGCNIGACGEGFTTTGCNYNNGVVWYSVFIPDQGRALNITLNSPDGSLTSPQIQIFSGFCNQLNAVSNCFIGGNGQLNVIGFEVTQNTNYWIAVGNNSGGTGRFDICFSASDPTTLCNMGHFIEVTATSLGSPLEGPYLPGEEVSFYYSFIFSSENNGIQWPHGVVPVAGPCWDNPKEAFQNASNFNWQWFEEPIVTYNSINPFVKIYYGPDGDARLCFWTDPTCSGEGLITNDLMPPGWWHINQQGQCGGDLSNPNNTWGSPCSPQCSASFRFTLTTKTFEECDGDQALLDCGLQFYVFSDFQTGCWLTGGENTCAADYPGYFHASLNCCDAPKVDSDSLTICSGSTFNIELSADESGIGISYQWQVESSGGIIGASSGEGPIISQSLSNQFSYLRSVIYAVRAKNDSGCFGEVSYITIYVRPQINVVLQTNPEIGCIEDSFDISASSAGGFGGPYSYLWSYNQTSDSIISGITPEMEGDFPISVTVTDNAGCTATASTVINVGPIETVNFQMEKTVFCYNEGLIFLKATPVGGDWLSLDSDIIIENNIIDPGQLNAAGIYSFVYSSDNINCPSRDTLQIEVIFSARDCPDKSVEIYTDGSESPYTGTIFNLPLFRDLNENSEVSIYDSLGRVLYYSKNNPVEWNPGKYPAGLYFCIVTIDGKNYQKVISVIK